MGLFNTIRSTLTNLQNIGQEYLDTQVRLLKVQAAEKVSTLLATIISSIILSLFLLLFLLFASVGLAQVLGDWIGRSFAGYLIVAAIYLITGLIVYKNKEGMLRRPILNAIIKQLFADKNTEKENGKSA
jgi:hypothetical protein